MRSSIVFNADQVEGHETAQGPREDIDRIAVADSFLEAVEGLDVRYGGGRAFYHPELDYVQLPHPTAFHRPDGYYSTLLHEAAHWTGHSSRLDRQFGKRFGDEAYAFEELVAELSAAFLCADLGVSNEPRDDHAEYVAGWLKVLKNDSRAIFLQRRRHKKRQVFLGLSRKLKKKEKSCLIILDFPHRSYLLVIGRQ